ncbi:hypothetical protein Ddye_013475 [Dipteronia dyeriana]|uniref:Uncharacterized protein n=1 Tax=Dipteronia dyeriana TaxID=168575 RepID=A0AAE0CJP2_9ROSI|nr:hypothetical protein Ddye_013475 [Dipteronia dyeriana]
MAVISHHCFKAAMKDKVSEYVHQCLTKSAYMQTYSGMIHPIPDQKRWPEVSTCLVIEGQMEHIDPPLPTVQPEGRRLKGRGNQTRVLKEENLEL